MQPEPSNEWLESKLVESCALLEEATREHQGICSALGLDPDELEPGEAARVAARMVEAHDAIERRNGCLVGLIEEAMAIVGVDHSADGAPSAFLARLHELVEVGAPTQPVPVLHESPLCAMFAGRNA